MNPRKQVKELEKQLKKDPSNMVLRLRLAASLVAAGRAGEGVALYKSVALTYRGQGRLEQARAVCEGALEIAPGEPQIADLLASLTGELVHRPAAAAAPALPTPTPIRSHRPSVYDEPSSPSSDPSGGWRAGSRDSSPGSGLLRPRDTLTAGLTPTPGPTPTPGLTPTHPPMTARAAVVAPSSGAPAPYAPAAPPAPPRRLPLPVKTMTGIAAIAPPVRRKSVSSPAPARLGADRERGAAPTVPPLTQPREALAARPVSVDDDAETRVAGEADAVPRSRRPAVAAPVAVGAVARAVRRGGDGLDGEAEATIVDDGMALARVMSPSLLAGGTGQPELPMFQGLPRHAVEALSAGMVPRRYSSGELVVREGDLGESCFVVARGELRVLKRDPLQPRSDLLEVSRLGEGAFFGEIALLADRRRHATVQAVSEVELFELPRALIRRVAESDAAVDAFLARFYRERLLANLLATAPFFAPLGLDERSTLAGQFTLSRIAGRGPIVVEGQRAGGFFLIVLGTVEITRAVSGDRTVLLATLGEGAYFGEMALLRGDVARASVSAVGVVEVAVLPAKNFYGLVASHPTLWEEVRREARRRELENVQILAGTTGSL